MQGWKRARTGELNRDVSVGSGLLQPVFLSRTFSISHILSKSFRDLFKDTLPLDN